MPGIRSKVLNSGESPNFPNRQTVQWENHDEIDDAYTP